MLSKTAELDTGIHSWWWPHHFDGDLVCGCSMQEDKIAGCKNCFWNFREVKKSRTRLAGQNSCTMEVLQHNYVFIILIGRKN